MKLEPIAAMLEAAGIGTVGTDIFVNMAPPVNPGILLRQYFGGTRLYPELPGYRKTTFMLIARAADYTEGWELCERAVAALTISTEQIAQGVKWKYMRPETEPFVYPASPGAMLEFQVNLDCCYVIL